MSEQDYRQLTLFQEDSPASLFPWLDEPDVPRVTKGMPNRANRLKCLGNAVVPQQAYPIFRAIAIEEGDND